MRLYSCTTGLLALLAVVGVALAAKGKATQAPLNCPEPSCAGQNCRTKIGNDGCLVCECGTSCPTLDCGPGCRLDTNVTQGSCPGCICDGEFFPEGGHGHCPEVQCPADCEKEQVIPPHRCPWCLCHPVTARRTLEKFGERHCPRELMEMLFRQADGLFKHIEALRVQLHHQDVAARRLDANLTAACNTPECTGKDCRLVPGEDGCPHCSCGGEVVKPKDKNIKSTLADKPQRVLKRRDKDESSEESKESDEKKHSVKRRHNDQNDSPEETDQEDFDDVVARFLSLRKQRAALRSRSRRNHDVGHNANSSTPGVASRADHANEAHNSTSRVPPVHVQCVMPVCEPYCKRRPAEHGCLVCDCPDVCPDIVCGAGCQPYFTETSRCERCVCNPEIRRDQMADVFSLYCSEPILHRMIADFGALERLAHGLQHQSFQHQHVISRAEQARGIHGPVSEELRAIFAGQQYQRHHDPHHHQAAHLAPLTHQPYHTEEPSKPHKGPKKQGGRRGKQDSGRPT